MHMHLYTHKCTNTLHAHTHIHAHTPFFLLAQVLKSKEYAVVFVDMLDAPNPSTSAVCNKTFVQSKNKTPNCNKIVYLHC